VSTETTSKKVGTILLWILSIGAGALMTLAGVTKFTASEMWLSNFETWGYPAASSYLIGALEVVGGLAVFVPRFATYGAGLVAVIMVGAAGTLLMNPGDMGPTVPLMNIIAFTMIAYARRGVRWKSGG